MIILSYLNSARLKNVCNELTLVLLRNMHVNTKYIKVFDWSQFSQTELDDDVISNFLNDPNFRVIKIVKNSQSETDLIKILYNEKMKNLLTNSSHLFFLSIESVRDIDLNEFDNVMLNIFKSSKKRAFLIEFCSVKVVRFTRRFIFNEGSVKELLSQEIKDIDKEEYEQKVSLINSLIIKSGEQSLLSLCLSNYRTYFEDDSYQMDSIGIRLLNTFDYNEQVDEEFDKQN